MKNAMKKLLSLMLAVMLLLSVVPFQAFATSEDLTGGTPINQDENSEKNKKDENNEDKVTLLGGTSGSTTVDLKDGDKVRLYCYVGEKLIDGPYIETYVRAPLFNYLPNSQTAASYLPGNVENLEFDCWSWENPGQFGTAAAADKTIHAGQTVSGSYLTYGGLDAENKPYGEMKVYAVFKSIVRDVTLDATYGNIPQTESKTIRVTYGQPYPQMPTPIRDGYTFVRWEINESGEIRDLTDGTDKIVRSSTSPYAVWVRNGVTVQIDWYDNFDKGTSTDWVKFDNGKYFRMAITADNSLSAAYGTFPTDTEITAKMNEAGGAKSNGYTLAGWKFKKTGADFTPGYTPLTDSVINANAENGVLEIVPKLQRTVYLLASNSSVTQGSQISTTTVEIGATIGGTLPNPNTWQNADFAKAFSMWASPDGKTVIATRDQLNSTDGRPQYYPALSKGNATNCTNHAGYVTIHHFDAQFVETEGVWLYFHENGNKSDKDAKKVRCYEIPMYTGFDMKKLDLGAYFGRTAFKKYQDNIDTQDGWYVEKDWKSYAIDKNQGTATTYLEKGTSTLDDPSQKNDDGDKVLHIMLVDNGTDYTYNSNNKTADKTNPKTGDIILAVVAVMVVSGAALAAIYYCTKKKRTEK